MTATRGTSTVPPALSARIARLSAMTSSDDRDDFANIAIAIVIFALVVGAALYFFNGAGAPVQTARQAPIGIDRPVPTIVPSQPR